MSEPVSIGDALHLLRHEVNEAEGAYVEGSLAQATYVRATLPQSLARLMEAIDRAHPNPWKV